VKPHSFAGQIATSESILFVEMRAVGSRRRWSCTAAIALWLCGLQVSLCAQNATKLSPKVVAAMNAPPAELKDDDPPLIRLKKERFNAALKEARARSDLYNRGLARWISGEDRRGSETVVMASD